MCGRFTLGQQQNIFEHFGLDPDDPLELSTSYNITPSQSIVTVVNQADNSSELKQMRWGLVPSWSKGIDNRFSMINARAESITAKPSFATPFRRQRCLIATDGFYEWNNEAGNKQPWYIRRDNAEIFSFAAIWDQWQSPQNAKVLFSCSIITTAANTFMQSVHARMPVIISANNYSSWLDNQQYDVTNLQRLLEQSDYSLMIKHKVSNEVNNPRNNHPGLIVQSSSE